MTILDIETQHGLIRQQFDDLFDRLIDLVELDGKTLKDALKSQLALQLELEVLAKKANFLFENAEIVLDDEYGMAIKEAMKDGYRSVTINEAKVTAACNKSYRHARSIVSKVKYLRDEVKGCLEVATTRRYTLHSMTTALIAGVDQITL